MSDFAVLQAHHNWVSRVINKIPLTPFKGMPQTQEYWEKRAQLDQEVILDQSKIISDLKHQNQKLNMKVNNLRKRLK